MIFNAAALTFVLELDEIMFHAVVPTGVHVLASQVEPLPRRWVQWRGVDLWPVIVLCFSAPWFFQLGATLFEHTSTLKKVRRNLCDGNISFVVRQQEESSLMMWTETEQFSLSPEDSFFQEAVRELIWSDYVPTTNAKSLNANRFDFQNPESFEDYLSVYPCFDFDLSDPSWVMGAFYHAVLDQAGVHIEQRQNASCEKLQLSCDLHDARSVRAHCPQTCGCDDPFSGQVYKEPRYGCPMHACISSPGFQEVLANGSCEDMPALALVSHPGWQRSWRQYLAMYAGWPEYLPAAEALARDALRRGGGVTQTASKT